MDEEERLGLEDGDALAFDSDVNGVAVKCSKTLGLLNLHVD